MIRRRTILALGAMANALALSLPVTAEEENVLPNGDFDSIAKPWALYHGHTSFASLGWSPLDVEESSASGSLLIANESPDTIDFAMAEACLPAQEGREYRFGFQSLVPAVSPPSGDVASLLRFYPTGDCTGPSHGHEVGPRERDVGSWETSVIGPLEAPADTRSLKVSMGVRKTEALPGAVLAHFDAAYVVVGSDTPDEPPEPDPAPAPPASGWFTDPTIPGFRFNVLITAGESSRTGNPEPTCLPETVCVSGAVPGRVEIFLRIVGPKPNGYLWPTLFKASTSRFDVWIDQKGTDVVRHYVLEAAEPGSSELPGLFDREGFLP